MSQPNFSVPIIYEDSDLLVLNKPYGLVVNRAESVKGETLQYMLEARGLKQGTVKLWNSPTPGDAKPTPGVFPSGAEEFVRRAGIAHRLDKDTSGVIIVAKNPQALGSLLEQFKSRSVEKSYLALVHGLLGSPQVIKEPIGRNPKNPKRFTVIPEGREAVTEVTPVKIFEGRGQRAEGRFGGQKTEGGYTLVIANPVTGRTHQIRVHLKHIVHPIVSDPIYLSKRQLREDLKICPRLFLHAESISFTHPSTGAKMRFEAELPEELQEVLGKLQ